MRRRVTPDLRCPACRLHRHLCLCDEVPVVDTQTRIVLVMHQHEERKTSNTGRLAVRCLPNSVVVAHGRLSTEAGWGRVVVREPPYPWHTTSDACVLLAPRDDALPIEDWRGCPGLTIVVPDGTWRQASHTRRRLSGLADLPCAKVLPEPPLYPLRRDPRPGRLGTLEAVARALGALEGDAVRRPLDRILRTAFERSLLMRGVPGQGPVRGKPPRSVTSEPAS